MLLVSVLRTRHRKENNFGVKNGVGVVAASAADAVDAFRHRRVHRCLCLSEETLSSSSSCEIK